MSTNGCASTGCGCSSSSAITGAETEVRQVEPRKLNLEFMYLDLDVCDRCQGSETNLEEALADVATVLDAAGLGVNVERIHVQSLEQALALGFASSPTIRLHGRDLQLEIKENACPSCSELSGTETNCRIWLYQGQEYSTVPKAMIIEAILRELYSQPQADVPRRAVSDEGKVSNLQRFFASKSQIKTVSPAVQG